MINRQKKGYANELQTKLELEKAGIRITRFKKQEKGNNADLVVMNGGIGGDLKIECKSAKKPALKKWIEQAKEQTDGKHTWALQFKLEGESTANSNVVIPLKYLCYLLSAGNFKEVQNPWGQYTVGNEDKYADDRIGLTKDIKKAVIQLRKEGKSKQFIGSVLHILTSDVSYILKKEELEKARKRIIKYD